MPTLKDLPIYIKRSNRKSLSVEITTEAKVLVRAPRRLPEEQILIFLEERKGWILRHLKKAQERIKEQPEVEPLTVRDLHKLAREALQVIPKKVAARAKEMGVTYGQITIRRRRSGEAAVQKEI